MTIFHYCSAQTFHSIVQNQSVWLSSLSQSNDSMEGQWIGDILSRLAEKHKFSERVRLRMQDPILYYRKQIDGLGLCLSRKGDLLSQWRGYAEDGAGFSIGFNEGYLSALGLASTKKFSVAEVIYDPDQQESELLPLFNRVKALIDRGAYGDRREVTLLTNDEERIEIEQHNGNLRQLSGESDMLLTQLLTKFFDFKSQAFSEENEVRLISGAYHPLDEHDQTDDSILYRHARGKIVPYRSFRLEAINDLNIIDEVVCGPKNPSNPEVVKRFLKSKGFSNASVRSSSATYC